MPKNSSQKRLKAVIFDLDGTIADSFNVFVETFEEVAKRSKPLTSKEVQDLRGLSLSNIITTLGVKKWQIPYTVIKGRREMAKKVDRITIFTDMPEVLKDLSTHKLQLYILSTNAEDGIKSLLERYDLLKLFSNIYADIGLTGKAKNLKKLMRNENLNRDECMYVGDETRDIDAAKKAGIRCVSVTWGFNNVRALKAQKPDIVVSTPEELKRAIFALTN